MEGRLAEGKEQALPVRLAQSPEAECPGMHTGLAEVWFSTWRAQVCAERDLWL